MPNKRRKRHNSLNNSRPFQASYHRGRQQRSNKTGSLISRFIPVVALAVFLAAVGWLGYIDSIEVKGLNGSQSPSKQLRERLREELSQHSFQWQIGDETIAALESEFANDIHSLQINRQPWQQHLIIEVRQRNPALNWQSGDDTYLIDLEGVVLRSGEDSSLPTVVDQAGLPTETGRQAVPSRFAEFAQNINTSDLEIETMRVVETSRELYAELSAGYEVRFDTTEDYEAQIDSVKRTQQAAEDNNHVISSYIDVRIPHKAYYK